MLMLDQNLRQESGIRKESVVLNYPKSLPWVALGFFVALIIERLFRLSNSTRLIIEVFVLLYFLLIRKSVCKRSILDTLNSLALFVTLPAVGVSFFVGSAMTFLFLPLRWLIYFVIGHTYFEVAGWEGVRRFLLMLRDLVFIASVLGLLLQYVGGQTFSTNTTDLRYYVAPFQLVKLDSPYTYRLTSVFGHSNQFAVLLVMVSVITLLLDESVCTKLTTLVTFSGCLMLTGSRGSIIALAVVALIMLIKFRFLQSKAWNILLIMFPLVIIITILLIQFGAFDYIAYRFASLQDSGSISYLNRGDAVMHLMGKLIRSPSHWLFGYGSGMSREEMVGAAVVSEDWWSVDNQYATLIYDFGIPLTMVLIGSSLVLVWQYLRVNSMKDIPFVIVLGILVVTLVSMLFYDVFLFYTSCMLFFFSLGVLSADKHGGKAMGGS